jgi:hypothetical protein
MVDTASVESRPASPPGWSLTFPGSSQGSVRGIEVGASVWENVFQAGSMASSGATKELSYASMGGRQAGTRLRGIGGQL